jgi:flagella basal body P-ring formation protein FlgA
MTVIEAVRPHHITGLDTRGIAEVAVTRASRVITVKDFEARLVRSLAGQYGLGEPKELAVTFDRAVRTLHVEPGAGGELGVTRLTVDPQTRRFDVVFEVPGSTAARHVPLRFIGSVSETVEAVVALRTVAQNEVIKAADVMVERRPKSEFAAAVATMGDVVGFAAKRALRQGQSIRATDVMKPELVARNETVTMQFEVPGILLSIRGRALEAGALGDLVNVLNIESKRTIQATVVGPGRVSVTSARPRLAANHAARKNAE